MATVKVGKFELTDGVLSGPAQYMAEQGNAKLARILAGEDVVFNVGLSRSPSVAIALLVALQTDYAGWLGLKQVQSRLK